MNPPQTIDGAVRLDHLGVLRASGAEAQKFLHSQLTNDMLGLGSGSARLAGFCSAKGRLQASFVAWKQAEDEVLLVCAASVLAATQKRLSMFILRSKCKLVDASTERPLFGLAGAAADALIGDAPPWRRLDGEGATLVVLPDAAGLRRCFWLGADAQAQPPAAAALSLDTWRWLEVQGGLPLIEAATVDQFVPQMVNFETVGGVDFQKGCYPGQEVVARSQYRGSIKRRTFLFDVDGASAAPGQEVFHDADPQQPAGMVVNAAPRPDGAGSSALVEVKLASLEHGGLHLGDAAGPALRRGALPYSLPLDAALPA
jgi:folate-binding protein YgfZ